MGWGGVTFCCQVYRGFLRHHQFKLIKKKDFLYKQFVNSTPRFVKKKFKLKEKTAVSFVGDHVSDVHSLQFIHFTQPCGYHHSQL